MPKLTPEEATAKWATRTAAATADMQRGIERVSQAPGQAAVQKRDKWRAGIQGAEEKWARNTGRVSLDAWKQAAINIGVQRVATGVQAKQHKMAEFQREFFPHLEAAQRKVAAMPDLTQEQRIARAVTMMRENANFRRTGR